ncbi:MAG: glycosyltransferase [Candidatus Electrothrix sp. AW1]|nr:glycosyltransferase [Candidatus Electrothrix sp. AX1]MCI5181606.1 glycosyltransferase [Candidatus Electrothrix gigas]MCI5226014.1 glycosyltransferase [Candidatus Electrothrix gigas]
MRRIGIVIYSLAGAGAERVAVNLASQFIKLGDAVDVILARREGELLDSLPSEARIYHAEIMSAKGWRVAIREYSIKKQPDVLLAMMEGAGVLSIQATNALDIPVYIASQVHFSRHYKRSARWKERCFMPLAARWYLPKAAGIIGASEGVSKDIQKTGNLTDSKVHTIYNPIITDELYTMLSEPVGHPWLASDRDWLTVVTVGRLTEQKDHDTLLYAIQKISKSCSVRLLILGQGERLHELKELASQLDMNDIVCFVGYDPNPHRFVAASDVFVLSSAWEGFGNVLVEALAAFTPVVSTDCPSGPSEVLAQGKFGQLVPVADSESLAEAIVNASMYPVDKDDLSEHLQKFESKRIAQRYLDVMRLTG